MQTIAVCIALYLAAAAFLNRYWGSVLIRLGVRKLRGWPFAFSTQAAMTVFLLCLVALCGQWRIFRQKRLPFYKGLIPGAYMLVISLVSVSADLMQAEGFSSGQTIVFSIFYFILIGVNEELIFRGIVADLVLRFFKDKTEGRRAFVLAAVVSSAIFSLSHLLNIRYADAYGVVIQMAGAFLMGMVLTVVYYRSRNIWCVIFIHAVNDIAGAFSVTVLRSENNVSGLISSYGIGELVMLIPYVIVLAVIMRKSKTEGIVGEFSSEKEGEADAI